MEGLKQQVAAIRESLFDQELLDQNYIQLESLVDNNHPSFVVDVMTLYFRDSSNLMTTIEAQLGKNPIDFLTLDRAFHQMKGSSASVGANKIRIEVNRTRELLKERNIEGVKASVEQLKQEFKTLKDNVDVYFQLLKQVGRDGL